MGDKKQDYGSSKLVTANICCALPYLIAETEKVSCINTNNLSKLQMTGSFSYTPRIKFQVK